MVSARPQGVEKTKSFVSQIGRRSLLGLLDIRHPIFLPVEPIYMVPSPPDVVWSDIWLGETHIIMGTGFQKAV